MLPFAFLTLSFLQLKGIQTPLFSYPFSLKIQCASYAIKNSVQRPSAGVFFLLKILLKSKWAPYTDTLPLRGADVVRAVHAARAYIYRG